METKMTRQDIVKGKLSAPVSNSTKKISPEKGNFEIIGYKADGKPLYAKRSHKVESTWKSKIDEQSWVSDIWF